MGDHAEWASLGAGLDRARGVTAGEWLSYESDEFNAFQVPKPAASSDNRGRSIASLASRAHGERPQGLGFKASIAKHTQRTPSKQGSSGPNCRSTSTRCTIAVAFSGVQCRAPHHGPRFPLRGCSLRPQEVRLRLLSLPGTSLTSQPFLSLATSGELLGYLGDREN